MDSTPSFAALLEADCEEDIVLKARGYIRSRHNSAETDTLRSSLRRPERGALFALEARALHKLSGDCDLLEAYLWHRRSGERQATTTKYIHHHLAGTDAYFHFDFKENVRYPMSKDETAWGRMARPEQAELDSLRLQR